MSILVSLTPAESKRLIGKGLCEHPLIMQAMENGRILISNGIIFNEIDALELLTGVKGWHTASGGVGGSEGNVTLVLEGSKEQTDAAFRLLKMIKGEPALKNWKRNCGECTFRCRYVYE